MILEFCQLLPIESMFEGQMRSYPWLIETPRRMSNWLSGIAPNPSHFWAAKACKAYICCLEWNWRLDPPVTSHISARKSGDALSISGNLGMMPKPEDVMASIWFSVRDLTGSKPTNGSRMLAVQHTDLCRLPNNSDGKRPWS